MTEADTPERIRALARISEIVTMLGMFALVLAGGYTAVLLVTGSPELDSLLRNHLEPVEAPDTMTPAIRAMTYMLVAIPIMVVLFALHRVRRLFGGFRRGEIMSPRAAHRLSLVGWAVLAIAPASIITQSLARTALALVKDPSQLLINIGLENADVVVIVLGLLIVVVGHIMQEASRISDENRSFV